MVNQKTSKRYLELLIVLFICLTAIACLIRYIHEWWSSDRIREEEMTAERQLHAQQKKNENAVKRWLTDRYHQYQEEHPKLSPIATSVQRDDQWKAMNQLAILQSRIGVYEDYADSVKIPTVSLPMSIHSHKNSMTRAISSMSCAYRLNAGDVLSAVLISGVHSGQPELVKAQVSDAVYDSLTQSHVLIPRGTIILGHDRTNISVGQERVAISFDRLIFPNGNTREIPQFYGANRDASAGIPAQVNTHFWRIFGSALAVSTLAAIVEKPASVFPTSLHVRANSDSSSDAGVTLGLNTVSSGFSDTVKAILSRNQNIPPTLFLSPGTVFHIVVLQDMCFPDGDVA